MNKNRRSSLSLSRKILAAMALLDCLGPASASAQTLVWTGTTNQFWGNGPNWDTGTAPTFANDVRFDASATRFSVNLGSGNRTVSGLTIDSTTAYTISNPQGVWLAPGSVTVLSGTGHTFDTTINLAGDSAPAYDIAGGSDLTISGVIDEYSGGSAGLTKTGAGTLILTADNLYAGTTTLGAGTLRLGDGGTAGSVAGNIATSGGTTLVFDRSDTVTYAGVISGTGAVEQAGTGTLVLTGKNTGTGTTTISAGTLQIGDGGTSGSLEGKIVNNSTLVFDRSDNLSFYQSISGSGTLTKEGAGTLTLAASNDFSGNTFINAGQINVAYTTALQNSTVYVNVNNGLGFGQNVNFIGGLAGSGDVSLGVNFIEVGYNDADTTYAGVLSGTGVLGKHGDGTLTLTGANTYTGGTSIYGGTLQLGDGGTSGSITGDVAITSADGTLAFNRSDEVTFSGVISGTGALTQAGTGTTILTGTNTYSGGTTISAGTLQLGDGGTTGSITGNVATTADGTLAFNRSDDLTFAGVISGAGGLTKEGTGTLTLTGASTYGGDTVINAGSLSLATGTSQNTALSNSTVQINAGASLIATDQVTRLGALAGGGALVFAYNGTSAIFVGGNDNAGTTFSGEFIGSPAGESSYYLTKVGTGSLTLPGTLPSWLNFQHNEGDLLLDGATGAFGSLYGSSDATVIAQNGAVLVGGGSFYSSALVVTGTGTALTINSFLSGQLQVNDGASLRIGLFENSYKGTLRVDGGALTIESVSSDLSSSPLRISDPAGGHALTFDNAADTTFSLVIADYTSGPGSVLKTGAGTLTLTGASTYSGGTTLGAGTLRLGNGGTTGSILGDVATTADGTLVFNRSDTATFAGTISGSGSVQQAGSGTTVLTATNTYTGGTTLTAGTLQLGDGGTTGSILGDVATGGGTTLAFNRSDDLTFAGVISGTGGVAQNGPGVLSLTGANTFTGDVTINSGQILLGSATEFSANTVVNNTTDGLDLNGFDATLGGLAGTGDLALGAQTLTVGGNNPTTYSGVLSGTGGLTKTGSGTLVLGGANTYTGGTTISAGTLQLGNVGTTGSLVGDVATTAGGTLTFNRTDETTFAGTISGSGAVRQAGTGTTTLTGANTYTGGTTISAGTLQLGDGGTSGSITGDVATTAGATLAFKRGDDVTYAGVISGTGGLAQAGTGTLTLTGANTYTGATTIADGATLRLGDGGTTGSIAGDIANAGALVFDRSNNFTYGGVITGAGSLTKDGAGTLTLSGDSTFSGATNVNAGTLVISDKSPEALANSSVTIGSGATLTLNDPDGASFFLGSLAGSGTLSLTDIDFYVGGNHADATFTGVVESNGLGIVKEGTGTWTLQGAEIEFGLRIQGGEVVLDGITGQLGSVSNHGKLTVQNVGADLTFDSLGNYGETIITGSGTEPHVLYGIENYAGELTIAAGAKVATTDSFYQADGAATVVDQATLSFGQFTNSSLGRYGTISLSDSTGGGSALTFGEDTTNSSTFAGVIQDHTSGPGSVTKIGTSTVILTGDNTYTGGTTISAGTLQLGDGGATGSIVGDVANAGTLAVNSTGDITLGTVSGAGALTKAGAGTLTLTGDATYSGATTISAGTLRLGGGSSAITLAGNIANNGTLAIDRSADLTLAGTISGTGALTKDGTGTLTLTANNTYSGGTTISAGTLHLGNGGTTGTITGDIVNHGALVLDRSNFLIIGNLISGTGSLEQAGSGFTFLTAANTFSGATTITDGQLVLGHALALQNSTLTLDGAGVFDFNGTDATLGGLAGTNDLSLGSLAITVGNNGDDTTYAGVLGGTGSLTKTGAGTLTLSADNTYSGGTTLSAGTLQLGDGGTTGSILGDVANSGTLAFNRSDDLAFTGAISGPGGVAQNGPGVLSLTGANTFTGDVTINAGRILLGSASEFATNTVVNNTTDGLDLNGFDATLGGLSGTGDLALGAQTLTVGGNGNPTTYAGALSGTGGLTKTGAGTLVLSGANTYTGGTTLSAGTLQLGNVGTTGSLVGDVATTAGSTLVFARTDTGLALSGVISGTGAVQQAGVGTTTLTGANTYSGGTTISAGTLQLGDGGTTGSLVGNVTTAAGGTLAFNRSNNLTYSNVISGAGGLTQAGTGTLILTANQTFTGTTTIEAGGTLQLGNSGTTGTVAGDIANAGDLVFSRSNNVTYAGVISGSGSLTKDGVGTLTLSGDSTFTGATTVDAGTLTLSPSGRDALANSAVTLEAGGSLTIYDPDGYTYSAGSLAGAGTLNLGGTYLYVGANNNDTTFSGTISVTGSYGPGVLGKYGSGTMTLSGGDINAPMEVYQGELVLEGITGYIGASSVSSGKLTLKNVGADLGIHSLSNRDEMLITGSGTDLSTSAFISNDGQLTISAGASVEATTSFYQSDGATTIVDQASLSFGKFSGGATGTISITDPTGGGSALTVGQSGSGSSTFAGVIEDYTSGPGSVTKVGTTTVILTGDNTYTGGTTLSAGTLQLGNGGTTGSILGDVANDGTLVFNRSDDVTFAGTISGTGSVEQAGTGTTILTADNTTTGGTTISAGTLQLGDGGTTGSIIGDVANEGTLAFNRGDDLTFAGIISGTGALAKDGAGTLTLTANNTYTGTTTISSGGTLQLGDGGTTGTVVGAIANDGALVVNRSNNFTLAGVISGTGSLTKEGAGTLTLTGDSTFSGDTVINGGAISIPSLDDTNYPFKNSTVEVNVDNGLVINGGGAYSFGALAGSGSLTLGSDSTSLYVGYNNADTVYSGNISGGDTVYKEGTGTWTLTGTNLDVSTLEVKQGGLVLDGAMGLIDSFNGAGGLVTLQNGADIAVSFGASFQSLLTITGSGTSLSVANQLTNSGGVLVQDGGNLQVGALYSSSGRTITVNQSTLTIKGIDSSDQTASIQIADPTGGTALTFALASDATFAGLISDYSGVSGSVLKSGAGTLTLSGANTHSGTTTISGGQIKLGHALALQNSTVSLGVADGLDLNGYAATLGGLTGSGNLALGSQALTVGGNGNSTTYTGILSGTGGSLTKTGDGTLVLTGTNTYTGGTTIDGGTLQLGDGGATGIVAGNIVNNGTLTIDRTDDFTFSGLISGTGDLAKLGTGGDLTLGAANTFSGTTTIEEGRIFLGNSLALQNSTVELSRDFSLGLNGNSATFGALSGTGAIYVSGTRTLTVGGNGADTTYSGSIQGDGGGNFKKEGAGTLVLAGNNTYTGTTTISAGTLQIGDGGTSGKLPGNVTNNAALVFNRSDDLTYAGVISGTGALTQAGAGTTILTGTHTYTGGTTISAGTLIVNGSAVNSAFTVNSGATLGGSGTIGALTVAGGGILAPGNSPGTLTFNGDLTLGAGSTLRIEIGGTSQGTEYDYLDVGGAATLGGSLAVTWHNGFTASLGDTFTFLTAAGGVSGSFSSTALPDLGGGLAWSYGQTSDSAFLTVVSAIPEPATWSVVAGAMALGFVATRRRRGMAGGAEHFGIGK